MTEILEPKRVAEKFLRKANKKFICIKTPKTVWLRKSGKDLQEKCVSQGEKDP
jgi:hypothetical protein